MRLVDQRRPGFGEHNLFFLALVGLESLGRRLDVALREQRTRVPVDLAPDELREDAFLCAVLGLIAFRARLGALLAAARCEPSEPAPTSGGSPARRSILR